jgi:hypothetical protein
MKIRSIARPTLIVWTSTAVHGANFGSATAYAGHGRPYYTSGYPRDIAEKKVLESCYHEFGSAAHILGAVDTNGYGAMAVGRNGQA